MKRIPHGEVAWAARCAVAIVIGCSTAAECAGAEKTPAPPSDFTGSAVSASHVDLSWKDCSDNEAGFAVERKDTHKGAKGQWVELGAAPAGATCFQSVGLQAWHTYAHRIRAVNKAGESPWVELAPIRTLPMPEKLRAWVLPVRTRGFARNSEGDMLKLRGGQLVFIYGRWPARGDHSGGTRIGITRSKDNGETWSEPKTLFQDDGYDLYHASLVWMKNGEIGLSYTRRKSPPALTGEKVFRYSGDEAKTWSDEIVISDGGWKFYQTSACDRICLLESGRLIHPVSRLRVPGRPGKGIVNLVYASDDNGRTWKRKTPKPQVEPNRDIFHEASIVEHAPGKLLLYARTRTGWVWESRSNDSGETWSRPRRSAVRGPVAPSLLQKIPGTSSIALFWNPITGTGFGPDRRVLAFQISDDGGRTWHSYRQLDYGPKARAYASCLWDGRTVHLTYMDFALGMNTRYMKLSKARLLGRKRKEP